MAGAQVPVKLKNVQDVEEAYEWLWGQQTSGKLDAKAVDGMNTTLKGVTYLKVGVPMKLYEMHLKAAMKKIELPAPVFLPEGMRPKA